MSKNNRIRLATGLACAMLLAPGLAGADHHENPCNPCATRAAEDCAEKAANPCNPCAAKAAGECADKAANPCNPCAAKTDEGMEDE